MKSMNSLPCSIETERLVLSAIIQEPKCFLDINTSLKPQHFFDDVNRSIYETLIEMDVEGIPIDQITLYEFCRKKNLADKIPVALISQIAVETSSSENAKYHSKIILEKYLLRQIIQKAQIIERKARNENCSDVFEFLSEAEGIFNKINSEIDYADESKEKPLGEMVHDIVAGIRKERNSGKKNQGIAFNNFPTLNKHVGGLMPGDLVGIYGREKSTKSTLAFSLMLDIGLQGIPGAYFSYEMQQSELIKKSLSLKSGVDYNKLRNPNGYSANTKISDEELHVLDEAANKLSSTPLIIIDELLNEYQIAAKLKQLIKRNKIKVAVVDYLLLVESAEKFKNTHEELNHLSKFFKRLAMQLNIAIIVISQANYAGERTAEGLGLQRDSNYFFYIERKDPGSSIKLFDVASSTEYSYTFKQNQFMVTLRGSRHSVSNRSFVVQYAGNQYNEVDTTPETDEIKDSIINRKSIKSYYETGDND